jgi:hypothetical protein
MSERMVKVMCVAGLIMAMAALCKAGHNDAYRAFSLSTTAELAKELSNSTSSPISVPFQSNFNFRTATDTALGSGQWAAGPTGVVLQLKGPWKYGMLANQLWSFAGDDNRPEVNQKVLKIAHQPMSIPFGPRVWAEGPSGNPEWGLRLNITLLFPK